MRINISREQYFLILELMVKENVEHPTSELNDLLITLQSQTGIPEWDKVEKKED
jgi:hypothetical protein